MKNNTKNIRKGVTVILFAVIMITSVLVIMPAATAQDDPNGEQQRLYPVADGDVYNLSYRNWNWANQGMCEFMCAGWMPGSLYERRAYLRFDLPAGLDISRAVLKLYQYHSYGIVSGTFGVYKVTSSWEEGDDTYHSGEVEETAEPGELCWMQQPSFDPGPVATFASVFPGPVALPAWVEVNITSLVQQWQGGTPNYGLVVKATIEHPTTMDYVAMACFKTKECLNQTNRPVLELSLSGTAPTPNQAPVADADELYIGNEGAPITFDASASFDPDGDALQYRWDFNNDETWDTIWSSDQTASFTWNDDWSGTAKVEVSDGELTDTDTASVTVNNVAPIVEAGPDQTANEGDSFSFSGSFTDSGTADMHTINWNFGDGSTASGTLTQTHAYGDNGVYAVTLTVTDDDGGAGTDTLTVTVENVPPSANAGDDQIVEQTYYQGTDVKLDGSGSSDPANDPLTYLWTWSGGSATDINPTVLLPLGTTIITLVITDGTADSDPDTVVVTVEDTTAPVLTCPEDVTVEQETAAGTEVTLEVTAEDICDADVEITSDAPAIFPLGTTTVTFTATDNTGNIATDTVVVTVEDTTAPVLTCPEDVTVEQETAAGTEVTLTATVSDICDANPTVTWSHGPTAVFPLGATTVTVTATDASGNSQSDTVVVTVIYTTLPEISVAVSPDTLWPANHKMVDITATVTATDICDAYPTVVLTSVTSNEPDDAKGNGDGKTVDDIQGADVGTEDYSFQLRAERAGGGDGRIYTITYMVTDASGNSASASATVVVPHDMD